MVDEWAERRGEEMEWPGSHILFLNSCPLMISDSQALLTRPLEPWSAKFSTSEPASPAQFRGIQLQRPAGGAAAPDVAFRGRHRWACEIRRVAVGRPDREHAILSGRGKGVPCLRCVRGPSSGLLKDMEQEACAIPWLSVHRDRKSSKEWVEGGGGQGAIRVSVPAFIASQNSR